MQAMITLEQILDKSRLDIHYIAGAGKVVEVRVGHRAEFRTGQTGRLHSAPLFGGPRARHHFFNETKLVIISQ